MQSERRLIPLCHNTGSPSQTKPSCKRETHSFGQKHILDRPRVEEHTEGVGRVVYLNLFVTHPPHQPEERASSL